MSERDTARNIANQIGLKPGESFQTQGQINNPHYHRTGGGQQHTDGYYVTSDGGVEKQHTDD